MANIPNEVSSEEPIGEPIDASVTTFLIELRRAKDRYRRYYDFKEIRGWLRSIKSTLKCATCGESHHAVLDFHHRDPAQKDNEVNRILRDCGSRDKVIAEIAKCEVLCSNCHRKLHASLREFQQAAQIHADIEKFGEDTLRAGMRFRTQSERMKQLWSTEEWRHHMNDPTRMEHMRKILHELYRDPVWRAEQSRRIIEGKRRKKEMAGYPECTLPL